MSRTDDLTAVAEELKSAFTAFKNKHDADTAELRRQVRDLENIQARMEAFGGIQSGRSAVCPPEILNALDRYARTGSKEFLASLSVGTDPEGGFFVAPQLNREIEKKEQDLSPIEQICRVVTPAEGSEWGELMDTGGIESGWVGETQARSETATSEVGKTMAPIGEIYANPKGTQKLLDDAGVDVAGWLTNGIAEEFAKQIGTASVTGNGINKPRGFLTYSNVSTSDATRDWKDIQYIPTGHATDFLAPTASVSPADCLIDTVHSLKAVHRRNARWTMNSMTLAKVRKFKDADGKFVVAPGLEQGAPERLLGYPIVEFEDMPAVGANAFPIGFGDWKRAYTLVLRGSRILRDPYTNKPFVHFYTTRRCGGGVFNAQALKLVKVATS